MKSKRETDGVMDVFMAVTMASALGTTALSLHKEYTLQNREWSDRAIYLPLSAMIFAPGMYFIGRQEKE